MNTANKLTRERTVIDEILMVNFHQRHQKYYYFEN